METSSVSDEEILRGLREHPAIRERIATLLALVQGKGEGLRLADDVEGRLIQEMRGLGRDAMQSWAQEQVSETEEDVRRSGRAHREGKKNFTGTPSSAT